MIAFLESSWKRPFDKIPRDTLVNAEDRWLWPPWEVNDIIGFVDIGMDSGIRLTGEIFLMRRYFPKESWENRYRQLDSKTEKDQILYFCELSPHYIDWHDNSTYIDGIEAIQDEAESEIKRLSKTKQHKWILQKLPFSLECIDFVKVASEIHPKFPKDA